MYGMSCAFLQIASICPDSFVRFKHEELINVSGRNELQIAKLMYALRSPKRLGNKTLFNFSQVNRTRARRLLVVIIGRQGGFTYRFIRLKPREEAANLLHTIRQSFSQPSADAPYRRRFIVSIAFLVIHHIILINANGISAKAANEFYI